MPARIDIFRRQAHRIGLSFLIPLISACSTNLPSNQYNLEQGHSAITEIIADSASAFGPRPEIPGPDELHQLTPGQLADFRAYLDAPENRLVPLHQRVFNYLEGITDNFDYYEATLPASTALETLSGNCMSLAVLTSALADIAGIDIGYKLMEDIPVFEYQGDTVIKGQHLSTVLYDADWTPPTPKGLHRRPGLQVDYFRSGRTRVLANADENDYLAMYYQNVAVESLADGDLDKAYWYALESLQYDPFHAPAINTLAIVHRRHGDMSLAEQLYRYGLATADDRLSLLRNYRALLVSQGRNDEARQLQRELDRKDDASPYRWIALASEAEVDGDYESAIRYYQRALELAPYMHEIQLGIALANYRAGHMDNAETALEKAIDIVPAPETRNLYETKLRVLTSQLAQ